MIKFLKFLAYIPNVIIGIFSNGSSTKGEETGEQEKKDITHSSGKHTKKSKLGTTVTIFGIIAGILFIIWLGTGVVSFVKYILTPSPKYCFEEQYVPVDSGFVKPGTSWITSEINYKFRFGSTGNAHNFFVQFTSQKGGWTDSLLLRAHEFNPNMLAPYMTQGPARVTAGPEEKEGFMVTLYKQTVVRVAAVK